MNHPFPIPAARRLFPVLLLLGSLFLTSISSHAASDIWNGGGAPDGNWQNPANWGGTVPVAGDLLTFDGSTDLLTTNNFAGGTVFDGLAFTGAAGAFTNDGNGIVLAGEIEDNQGNFSGGGIDDLSPNAQIINFPLTNSAGAQVITTAAGAGSLTLAGGFARTPGALVQFNKSGGAINSSLANNSAGIIGGWALNATAATLANNNGGAGTVDWAAISSGAVGAYNSYATVSGSGKTIASAATSNVKVTSNGSSDDKVSGTTTTINTLNWTATTQNGYIDIPAGDALQFGAQGGVIANTTKYLRIGNGTATGYVTAGGAANTPGELSLYNLSYYSGGALEFYCFIKDNGSSAYPVTVNIYGSVNFDFANTYSGGTYINAGSAYLNGGSSPSFGYGPVYIYPGARADFGGQNSATVTNSFYLEGYGFIAGGSPGAIKGSYNGSFTGLFTLLGDASIDPNAGSSPNTCTFTGPFGGTGMLTIGGPNSGYVAGTATIGGIHSYTGDLAVDATANNNGGAGVKISSGKNNLLQIGGNVNLIGGGSGVASFDLNGTTQNINGLTNTTGNAANALVKSSTTGGVLVVGGNNASSTFGGVIEDGGGSLALTKTGTGTLVLDSVNSYSGPTIVSNGVLSIGNSLASAQLLAVSPGMLDFSPLGTFNLAGGQTLGGNGSVNGGVSAASGATISPGFGAGTLTISNNLTLNTGSVGAFVLAATTNAASSRLAVAGSLILNGGTIQISATTLQVGRYPLITYAGTESGSVAANLTLGYSGTQNVSLDDSISGEIDLVVSSAFVTKLTWQGDGSQNIWDVDNTADWLNGGVASVYTNATAVLFTDTGSQSPAVNLTTTVQPLSLLVSNNSGVYTLGGGGNIAGGTALTKLGSGALVLADTGGDSFSGGVLVGGGSLTFANSGMNISGGLTVSNSTAAVDGSGAFAGNLTVEAGGSVLLDQAPGFTFTGNTIINTNATAQLGADDGNGVLPTGGVTVNGTLTFEQTSDNTVANPIAGYGTLVKNTNNTVTFSAANSFAGSINVTAGTLSSPTASGLGSLGSGTITIANGATLDKGTDEVKPIVVSGTGVNGLGAIVNTSGNPIYDGGNGGLSPSVTLTGDTMFGGSTRMDLGGNAGAVLSTSGSNYNVVIDNATYIEWQKVAIDTNLGNIDVLTAYFGLKGCGAGVGNPTNTITVHPGADLQFWGDTSGGANSGYAKNIHVLSGGLVEFRPQTTNTYYACPLTLEDGSGLNMFNGSGTIGTVLLGPVALNGLVHFQIGDSTCTISNVISGPGGFYWDNYNNNLVFTATNTYQGVTDLRAGRTLVLGGNGSILQSSNILLGAGATLDASGRADGTFTLGSQTLAGAAAGSATINGSLDASASSTLVPGGSGTTGILTVSSNAVLQGTLAMDLDQSNATNDVVNAGANSTITYGGTLDLTTITGTLAIGQSYKLFNAGSYSGAFAAISPVTPGAGLVWNTNSLTTSGVLEVASAVPPVPVITGITLSGTTLTLTATNGAAGNPFVLLGTTNLTLPLAQWTPVLTNNFDDSGNLSLSTNIVLPGQAAEFYILAQ